MKKRISLWQKIFSIGMIPVLFVSLLISMSSYRQAKQTANTLTENAISAQVKRVDLNLNTRTKLIEISLQSLVDIVSTEYENVKNSDDFEQKMKLYMGNMAAPFSEIRAAMIFLGNDNIYTTSENLEENMGQITSVYSMAKESPDKVTISKGDISLFSGSNRNENFLFFKAITCQDQTIGFAAFEVGYRLLGYNILSQQRIQQDQTTYMLNEKKQLIYSDNYLDEDVNKALITSYLSGNRKTFITVGEVSYFAYMLYSGTTGWVIISFIPESKLFSGSETLRKHVAFMLVLGILISSIVLMVFSHLLLRPVQRLKAGMERLQEGNLDVKIKRTSRDEIGALTDAFNHMVIRIKDLINHVYRQEIAKQHAEIEALQAQINPHFLYNTLDSIKWMLFEHGEEEIGDLVISLAKLMQYSMKSDESIVPLRSEYENIKNYLLLQKNRVEDRLTYSLLLDPKVENFLVPKLILQPLVENAIIHGVLPADRPGNVLVETMAVEEKLQIVIKDDGVGMDNKELEHFLELCHSHGAEHSIGVNNVMKRLYLHYGEEFEVFVESKKELGTILKLLIPLRKAKNEDCNN